MALEASEKPKLTLTYLDPPNIRTRSPEETHAEAMAMGAKCRECPLFGLERGPIQDQPHSSPMLVMVAEHPGQQELEERRPLCGRSGKEVDRALAKGGVGRFQVAAANAMLCSPGMGYKDLSDALRVKWKKEHLLPYQAALKAWREHCAELKAASVPRNQWPPAPPQPKPMPLLPHQACQPRLERFLKAHQTPVTLTLGKTALDAVCEIEGVGRDRGKTADDEPYAAKIGNQHGAPIPLNDGRKILPTFLPGRVFWKEKRHWLPVIRDEIQRAARLAQRGGRIEWVEPPFHIDLGPDEIINAIDRTIEEGYLTTVDIETDGIDRITCRIRCIQIATRINGEPFVYVIRLHHMDGSPWWGPADMERLRKAVQNLMDTNPLGAQFGTFDFTVLLEQGYMTDHTKPWVDALLLHKNTQDNDLQHNLGFMARRLFDAYVWKADIEHKSVNNVDDYKLHLYGVRDVWITHRIIEALWPQVMELGTVPQYTTDYQLAPIFRQAGHMGLPIDEELRGHYSRLANRMVGEHLRDFWDKAGCHGLNPKSVPQLQDLIYGVWGYSPPVEESADASYGQRDQREDNEIRNKLLPDQDVEENRSTSSQTITALLATQVRNPKRQAALGALLQFRAIEKIRSTYVDKVQVHYHNDRRMGFERHVLDPVTVRRWDGKLYAPDKGADGWYDTESIGRRPAMSVLHTTYKQTIPTGRLASSPNCFSDDTEILTDSGWKLFKDLIQGVDKVAHFSRGKIELEFAYPTRIVRKRFEGNLVHVRNEHVDLLMTPDHRCLLHPSGWNPSPKDWDVLPQKAQPFTEIWAKDWPEESDDFSISTLESEKENWHRLVSRPAKASVTKAPYGGWVYCVTTLEGTVVVRRRGKAVVTLQCQNWPSTGAVDTKAQIVAPPGHSYFGADFCQLEGRIYTAVAQDQILLDVLNTGKDLHSSNVATLRAESPDRLQYWYDWALSQKDNKNILPGESASGKMWRTIAKVFVFSLLYGAEVPSLYEFMRTARDKKSRRLLFPDIKISTVQRWYDQWHKFHPETKSWWAQCRRFLKRHGYIAVPALDGRRRYFPAGPSKQNAVMNMMIQGFAASVMNKATLEIYDAIPFGRWSNWTGIALQVHDDLRILAPDEHADYVKDVIAQALPFSWGGVDFAIDAPEQDKRLGSAYAWSPSKEEAESGYKAVPWQSRLVEGISVQTVAEARAAGYQLPDSA